MKIELEKDFRNIDGWYQYLLPKLYFCSCLFLDSREPLNDWSKMQNSINPTSNSTKTANTSAMMTLNVCTYVENVYLKMSGYVI